jgi:hypothetical protein
MDNVQNGLVVIWGDFNSTLGESKFWVPTAQLEPLSSYFIRKLEENGLLDIEPSKLSPT